MTPANKDSNLTQILTEGTLHYKMANKDIFHQAMPVYSKLYLKLFLEKIEDYLRYDVMGQQKQDFTLPPSINLTFGYDKDDKSYFAQATHQQGVYTTAQDINTLLKNINYQLFEYFYVPRYRFKELGNYYKLPIDALEKLKEKGAPVKIKIAAPQYAPA